jgi:hypothetical protein
MSKKMMGILLALLFTCLDLFQSRWVWAFPFSTRGWLMLSSLNACLILARVPVPLVPRFAWNLMHTCCWIHREITSSQIHNFKWMYIKYQHILPVALNCIHLQPKMFSILSTTGLCCFNWFLYRRWHQCQKLRISVVCVWILYFSAFNCLRSI